MQKERNFTVRNKLIYLILFFISATTISFEIISTRISSVIFVYNYAFMILSLAILGLGCGAIYSFYKLNQKEKNSLDKVIHKLLLWYAFSLTAFIAIVVLFSVTNYFVFFILLFIPFFLAGVLYSLFFKQYSESISRLYAADLSGAAVGAFIPLLFIKYFGAANSILFLSSIIFFFSLFVRFKSLNKRNAGILAVPTILAILLLINGKNEFLGRVPIGNFPEKDFYYVYSDINVQSYIIDSRWSIYGRADLVKYSHQDMVRQMFIDGAAGTQMYRFNGDIKNPDRLLVKLLLGHSTSIPFLFLDENQKDSLLVIGPGGGKEILTALLSGIRNIIGVEINPDFVEIVKSQSQFNGGIYSKFSNVKIIIKEGRNFVKQTKNKFDVIVVALPSTKQLQNIDAFAMSENYLLTSEAMHDYLNALNKEGMLIFTLHNKWELLRFIVTIIKTFEKYGVPPNNTVNHLVILEDEYAPTIIVKKLPFTFKDIQTLKETTKKIPPIFPRITFMPYMLEAENYNSFINNFLLELSKGRINLNSFISNHPFDISPVKDDNPFFYKTSKLLPSEMNWLFLSVLLLNLILMLTALRAFKKEKNITKAKRLKTALFLFATIGAGFMILEVTLFQKLILYVGTPTVSLSLLLFSMLTGMGIGSLFREKFATNYLKLRVVCLLIIFYGIAIFFFSGYLFDYLLYSKHLIIAFIIILIFPFGILLGTLFPSFISLLKENNLENYIPWMYGMNAVASVLGSVLSYSLAMLAGFTFAFIIGLSFYFFTAVLVSSNK